MNINWALTAAIVLISSSSFANDIYVNQIGDDLNLDIVQDGQNNQVEHLHGSGDAYLGGDDKTANLNQTGNSNHHLLDSFETTQTITANVTETVTLIK